MLRYLLPSTLLAVWTCTASPCRADPTAPTSADEPLAVIGISCGAHKEQGEALTRALRRTLDASVEWQSLELRLSMDELMSAAGCSEVPGRVCLAKIAHNTGLTRFVWGALTLKRGRVAVQLALFNVDSAGTTAQLDYSSNMIDTFDENLLRLANNGLARLLGPIHYPVQIRSRQSKGTVVIDDVVSGTLESGAAEIAVTAGDHRFRLVLPDATVIARTFQVLVDARNRVRLEFMDIPES